MGDTYILSKIKKNRETCIYPKNKGKGYKLYQKLNI